MSIIYTIGYGKSTLQALLAAVPPQSALVDVRLRAASYNSDFYAKPLCRAFGERYHHLPVFGNVNYKGGGPIQIADVNAGIFQVSPLIEAGDITLMCACSAFKHCHRSVVADILSSKFGASVVHLPPLQKPPSSQQPAAQPAGLF